MQSCQSDDELITLIQGHGFKGQGHRQHLKKYTFPAKASVLSIATKTCKFVKASASGCLCPHPRTRGGVPLYPAGGIISHISRPSWLHQLYNTSRASACTVTEITLVNESLANVIIGIILKSVLV